MLDDAENLRTETGAALPEPPPPELFLPTPPPLAPRDIWKPRDFLLFVAFIPFALVASKIVVLIGYVAVRPFAGWRAHVDVAQTDTLFMLVQQCIFYALILGFLVLLARLQHNQPIWRSLGWTRPTLRQLLFYLAGGGALAIGINIVLWLRPDTQGFPLEQLFTSRAACYAIGVFAVGIAPLVEEVVFRGLLFAIVERAAGLRAAVAATAVLFAGLHIPEYWHAWNHLLMILVVGLVFSLARGATGGLAPSIILHVGYNSIIMGGLFLSTEHFRVAPGWLLLGVRN
jgi:membrane protease YdiL (CAAX protease family)